VSCIEASPGHYVNHTGSIVEYSAPLDFYAEYYGMVAPTPCPGLHITLSTGSLSPSACLLDSDYDRIPDSVDNDDDNDGMPDQNDFCSPGMMGWISGFVEDQDRDGCRDADEDLDDDNDGVPDTLDDFPLDPSEHVDTDGDGVGDNADFDDDDDRLSDSQEYDIGTDPLDSDTDDDGYSDKNDAFPLDHNEWADSDGDGAGDNSDVMKDISRYQTSADMMIDLAVVAVLILSITAYVRSKK